MSQEPVRPPAWISWLLVLRAAAFAACPAHTRNEQPDGERSPKPRGHPTRTTHTSVCQQLRHIALLLSFAPSSLAVDNARARTHTHTVSLPPLPLLVSLTSLAHASRASFHPLGAGGAARQPASLSLVTLPSFRALFLALVPLRRHPSHVFLRQRASPSTATWAHRQHPLSLPFPSRVTAFSASGVFCLPRLSARLLFARLSAAPSHRCRE